MKNFTFLSKFILVFVMLFSMQNLYSQSASWNYTDSIAASSPIDMTGKTALVTVTAQQSKVQFFSLPFAFQVYDDVLSTSDQLQFSTAGFIGFKNSPLANNTRYIDTIPTNSTTSQYAHGEFLSYGGYGWGSINIIASDTVWQKTTGTSPNRIYTLQFQYHPYYGSWFRSQVQISFYETTNRISVDYFGQIAGPQVSPNGDFIGINVGDGVYGTLAGNYPSSATKHFYIPGDAPDDPVAFAATTVSSRQIDLSWTKNANNNDIFVTYNTVNQFDSPVSGTAYTTGTEINAGKGRVVYQGSAANFSMDTLSPNKTYYYQIWSKNSSNIYSSGHLSANATTDPVVDPTAFSGNVVSTSEIDLSWTLNSEGNDVIVTYNTVNNFAAPTHPNNYALNTEIAAGAGRVLYKGNATSTQHTGLLTNTTYYYMIWSYNGLYWYSTPGVSLSKTTQSTSNPVSLTPVASSSCNINVSWVKNSSSTPVMVVYNTTNSFTTPTDGQSYTAGHAFANGTVLYVGAATSTSLTPALDNQQYFFRAYSYDASHNYSSGITNSVTTPTIASPGTLTATAASTTQIDLSWALNAASDDVIILYNTTSTFGSLSDGTTYSNGQTITGGGTVLDQGALTTKSHTGLNVNAPYYYKVYSYDCAKNYSAAKSANATTSSIADPTSLTTANITSCGVTINWTQNSSSNDVLVVYNTTGTFTAPSNGTLYSVGASIGSDVVLSVGSGLTKNHTPITDNQTLYYKAYSYDASYNYSPGITATANIPLIEATGTVATNVVSNSEIDLSWALNTAGDDVIILYNTNSGTFGSLTDGSAYNVNDNISGGGTVLYKGNATTFQHTGLSLSTHYYYKVYSYDCAKNYSAAKSADISTGSLGNPTNFIASATSTCNIDLSWTKDGTNNVMIVYNTTNNFGTPFNGFPNYFPGMQISSNHDTILYMGGATSTTHSPILDGTKYYYKAFSYDGNYYFSSGTGADDSTSVIEAPSGLTSTAGSTTIDLSWTANAAADDVIVLKNTTNTFGSLTDGQTYVTGATLGSGLGEVLYQGSATSLQDAGLTVNTTYYYKVFSFDCAKNYSTGISKQETTVVSFNDPAAFSATTGSSSQINLAWTANANSDSVIITYNTANNFVAPTNGTSYIVGNQIQTGKGTVLYKGNGVSPNSMLHTGLPANTKYYYMIWSYDPATNYYSSPGILDSATTDFPGIATFPHITDFENQTPTATGNPSCSGTYYLLTDWVNVTGDDKDWIPRTGATPYSQTGPANDHTTGSGKYVYAGGYGGGYCINQTAWLVSPLYNFTSLTTPKLDFYYHMYGSTMGKLSVQVSTNGGTTWSSDIWYKQGQQQTSPTANWGYATINLGAYAGMNNVKIRITSLSGTSWRSDMAVDDIKVYEPQNMSITSVTTEQDTLPVYAGYSNQEIIRVKVTAVGTYSPLTMAQLGILTSGTTALSDIHNAKIYYTGNSPSFAATQQFGSTVASPTANFPITGSQVLSEGDNYFWLTYDIQSYAVIGNNVDAACSQVTISGTNYTPTVTSPTPVKEIKGQVTVGTGTSTNWQGPVFPSYYQGVDEAIYLASEIGTGPKEINKLEWSKASGNNITNQITEINIYMKNSTTSTLSSGSYSTNGYTLVYHGPMPNNKVTGWLGVNLDNTFLYDGTSNIHVLVVQPKMTTTWSGYPYWNYSSTTSARYRSDYSFNGTVTSLTASTLRPNARFEYVLPQPMVYLSSVASHPTLANVPKGGTNQEILKLSVQTQYTGNPLSVSSLVFNTNGSTSASDIANAKVYYTGSDGTFNTSTQFGSTSTSPSGSFTVSGTQTLVSGTNYFWLVYDISSSATVNNVVDASCTSIVVGGTAKTPSITSPTGNRKIKDYITIGTGTASDWQQPLHYRNYHAWEGIYLQSELGAAKDLSALAFYKASGANTTNDILNVTIYIKHTTATSVSSGSYSITDYTEVYNGNFPNNATSGWMEVPLNQVFAYNGTDNLEVLIVQSRGIYFSSYPYWAYSTTTPNRARYNNSYSSPPTSLNASNRLANIRFEFAPPQPMTYVSSTTTQNNVSNATAGVNDQEVIGIEVVTTNSLNPLNATSFTFNTTGTTSPSADITNAKVYYTGTSSSFSAINQFGTAVANPNGTFTVTSTQALTNGTNYFWLAYDVPSTANTGDWIDAQCTSITVGGSAKTPTITNPIGNRAIVGALSGYYTIGTGGDYSSFAAAVNALNTYGVSGWVTFRVFTGTYNEKVNLNAVTNAGATRPITFESFSGDSTDVVLTYSASVYNDAATIKFDAAEYFIIKDMTIKATGTYGHAIESAGASNMNVVRNCVLESTSNNSTYGSVVYSYGSNNNNTNIINNKITAVNTGIYLRGTSSTSRISGWNLDSNIVIAGSYGVYLRYTSIVNVKANQITVGASTNTAYGIYDYYSNSPNEISGNKINTLATNISYGMYLYNCTGTTSNKISVFNNFIANTSNATNSSIGLYVRTSSYVDVDFNNVNITGTSGTTRAALYGYLGSNVSVKNNNFVGSGGGFSQYWYSGSTVSASDYNNMYSTGTNLAYYNGNNVSNLAAWKTVTSKDANSLSVNPNYTSTTDLHISNQALNNMGTPISGITIDIDGDARNTTAPDIGADEFGSDIDAGIASITDPVSPLCSTGNNTVKVNLKNYGATTLTSVTINWKVGGVAQTPYSWTGSLASNAIQNITLGSFNFTSGSHLIEAWTSNPNSTNDQYTSNDSASATIIVGLTPTVYAGADTSICSNSYTINDASATNYSSLTWSTSGGGSFVNGSALIDTYTPSASDYTSGSVYLKLKASTANCGFVEDSLLLSLSQPPVVTFTGLANQYCANDEVDTLVGIPSGGTFTGSGMSGVLFDPSAANIGSDTITYTYTSGSCSGSASQIITVNSAPSVTLNGLSSAYCDNDNSVTLSGTPAGGSFGGDGVSGNTFDPSQTTSSPASVWYSYTDATTGCTATDTNNLTINAAPIANAGSDQSVTVFGSTTLNGSASGGTGSYTYSWTPTSNITSGANSATATTTPLLVTTTYTLNVTNVGNSCSSSDQTTVTVTNPIVMIVFANANPDTVCLGDSLQLTSTVNGGNGNNTYSWTSNPAGYTSSAANPWIHPTQSAWYKLYVTDGTLNDDDSVYVVVNPIPNVSFTGLPATMCSNDDSVQLVGTPTPGLFSGSGLIGNYFYPSNVGAGSYDITYTNTNSFGCSNSDTQTVVVNSAPIANAGIDQNITSGSSTTLNGSASAGSGSYSYSWTPLSDIASGATTASATTNALTASTIFTLSVSDNNNSCTDNDNMLVVVGNNSLAATATATPDTVCNGSSSQLLATAAGGSGTYTYSWSSIPVGYTSTIANPIVTPTISTTYTVTVSDGTNSVNASTSIVVNSAPIANAGIDQNISLGSSTTLSGSATGGSGNYTYSWSPASDLVNANIQNPTTNSLTVNTTFTLTVTDANTSCFGTDDMVVNVSSTALSIASISASPDTMCKGSTTQLQVSAVGGSGNYTYQWASSPAGFSSTLSNPTDMPNSSTTYYVTVNDGGSSVSDSVKVVVNPMPSASFSGLNSDYCSNDAIVTLVGSPAGGAFTGNGISGSQFDPSNATTGTNQIIYSVSLGNCSDADTQYVDVHSTPIANAGTDQVLTGAGSTTLNGSYTGGSNVGYFWTPTNLLSGSSNIANPTTVTLSSTTVYTLETKDTVNLCSSNDQVTIQITGVPLSVTAAANPTTTCAGDTVHLSSTVTGGSTGIYSYQWTSVPAGYSSNLGVTTANPNVSTTYTVRVIDGNDTAFNSVSVTVNPLPNVSFIGLSSDYCDNSSNVSLVGTPAGGVFSGAGITGNQFDPTQANVGNNQIVYTATVNGCTNSDTQNVVINETPIANAGTDIILTSPGSTTLNGSYTGGNNVGYFWTPASMLVSSNIANPTTVNLTSTQVYTLEVKDTINQCSSNDQVQVIVSGGNVSITTSATPSSICVGDTSTISTVVSGGNGTYNYSWSSSPAGFSSSLANVDVSPSVNTTYTVSVTSGSTSNTSTVVVTVNPLPSITFSGLNSQACSNDATMNLIGSPTGGVFTGTGVSMVSGNYVFDPSIAGSGNWDVVYNYSDAITSCSNSDTQSVVVNSAPIVNAGVDQNVVGPIAVTLSGNATNAANYKYNWMPTAMVVSPNLASTQTVTLSSSQLFTLKVEDSVTTCFASDDVLINVGSPNPVTATASASLTTICSGSSSQLNVLASGGNPPYTYSWTSVPAGFTSSIANPVVSPSITTVYSVQVSDGTTSANSSVTITVNSTPAVAMSGLDTSYCNNGITDTLQGFPTGGFFTGNGISANLFSPNNAGIGYHTIIYSYTATNGCMAADTQITHVYSAPTANAGSDFSITAPSTATLSGSATGGSGNYAYSWSPSSLFANPNQASVTTTNNLANTTIFTLEVTDQSSNCKNTDDVKVMVQGGPLTLNPYASDDTICEGEQVQLFALAGGGSGNYQFAWTSIPSGYIQTVANPYAAPTVTTKYIVNVLDITLMTTLSDTVEIVVGQIPNVSITSTNSMFCENGISETINATPLGGIFFGSGMSGNMFNPNVAGVGSHQIIYEYTSALGCTSSDTTFAFVQAPPTADAGSDIAIPCNGAGGLIGSNPIVNKTYQWSPISALSQPTMSNTIANPSQNTLYTLTVTDTITSCSNTDQVQVNVTGAPTLTVANDTIICGGESVNIYAGGTATSYIWSNGIASPSFNVAPSVTTVYTVTATDSATSLCSVVDSVVVTVNAPYVFLGPDISVVDTQIVYLDAGFGFQHYSWNTGDTLQAIEVAPYVNSQLGMNKYVVEVSDVYGCRAKDSVMINYILDIEDISSDISFDLYPNPTKGIFTIEIQETTLQDYSLEVVNIQGQLLEQRDIHIISGQYIQKMDFSSWPKGIYIIRLKNDRYLGAKKLIIQ